MISFAFTRGTPKSSKRRALRRGSPCATPAISSTTKTGCCRPSIPKPRDGPTQGRCSMAHVAETSGAKIINALLYLEDWRGGVPLREARYSLGNTVLKIAGSAGATGALGRQDHRHRADRADRRLRSGGDAHHGDLGRVQPGVGDRGREDLHHLRRKLRRGVGAGAPGSSRAARPLHLHGGEGNARLHASGGNTARWAYASRTPRASCSPAAACRSSTTSTAT